jgi:hypothetical protein
MEKHNLSLRKNHDNEITLIHKMDTSICNMIQTMARLGLILPDR